jgi:ubiquinone/menaquinone biosynthesis C-methylase UbiE
MSDLSHPIFARFYRVISNASDRQVAPHRAEMLDGLAGTVVEVGCGNGLNFVHYPSSVERVIAIEPDPYLRGVAEAAAAEAAVEVDLRDGRADDLDLDDSSVDGVVFSLVLCSVPDQAAALAEAHRVLRPGGSLRFYEHVVSPTDRLSRVQRGVDRVWPRLFGGCHTSRDTTAAIENAGFTDVDFRRFDLTVGPVPLPVSPHVLGSAVSSPR